MILMCIPQLRTTDPDSWDSLKRATECPGGKRGGEREGGGVTDKQLLSTEH